MKVNELKILDPPKKTHLPHSAILDRFRDLHQERIGRGMLSDISPRSG